VGKAVVMVNHKFGASQSMCNRKNHLAKLLVGCTLNKSCLHLYDAIGALQLNVRSLAFALATRIPGAALRSSHL
jgi:hypothetical protein